MNLRQCLKVVFGGQALAEIPWGPSPCSETSARSSIPRELFCLESTCAPDLLPASSPLARAGDAVALRDAGAVPCLEATLGKRFLPAGSVPRPRLREQQHHPEGRGGERVWGAGAPALVAEGAWMRPCQHTQNKPATANPLVPMSELDPSTFLPPPWGWEALLAKQELEGMGQPRGGKVSSPEDGGLGWTPWYRDSCQPCPQATCCWDDPL